MSKDEEIKLNKTKKIDRITEEFDLDDDFGLDDFDDDFDVDDEREPVTKENLKKRTKETFSRPVTTKEIITAIESSIPNSIKKEYDSATEVYRTTRDEITKNLGEFKKEFDPLRKSIEKFASQHLDENNLILKFLNKLKPEEEYKYTVNKEKERDEEVERTINKYIGSQEEFNTKVEAMNQIFADRRTASTNELLGKLHTETAIIKSFNLDYVSNYQRKSLELQYRSTLFLKDLIEETRSTRSEYTSVLKAIVHNTSLPDIVKQRQLELFGADIKTKLRSKIVDRFVNPKNILENIKSNIRSDISDLFDPLKSSAEAANMGRDMIGEDTNINKLVPEVLRGLLLQSGASKLNNKLINSKYGKKALYALKQFGDDPSGFFRDLQDFTDKDNIFTNTIKGGLSYAERITRDPSRTQSLNLSRLDLDQADSIDVRTKASINKVIPGYLRKIHAEIKANRLNFKDFSTKKFELSYSHAQDQFIEGSSLSSMVMDKVRSGMKNNTEYAMERITRNFKNVGTDLTDDELKTISNLLGYSATQTNTKGLKFLNSKKVLDVLPKELIDKYQNTLNKISAKAQEDDSYYEDIRYDVDYLRNSIPSYNKLFEELFKSGEIDTLLELGLIRYDDQREDYVVNQSEMVKFMFGLNEGNSNLNNIGKSNLDQETKERTKRFFKKAGIQTSRLYSRGVNNFDRNYNKKKTTNKFKNFFKGKPQDFKNTVSSVNNSNLSEDVRSKISKAESVVKGNTPNLMGYYDHNLTDKNVRLNSMTSDNANELTNLKREIENRELEYASMKLLDSALSSGSDKAVEDAIEKIESSSLRPSKLVKDKINEVKNYIKIKKNAGDKIGKQIANIEDPHESIKLTTSLLDTGLNILPFRSIVGLLTKGMGLMASVGWKGFKFGGKTALKTIWGAAKMGWRNEKWLMKNVYGPMLNAVTLKPAMALAKLPLSLIGLTGLGKLFKGKEEKVGINLPAEPQESGSSWWNKLRNPFKRKKQKIINGLTEEEFNKRKNTGRKKSGVLGTIMKAIMGIGGSLVKGLASISTLLSGKLLSAITGLVPSLGKILLTGSLGAGKLLTKGLTSIGGKATAAAAIKNGTAKAVQGKTSEGLLTKVKNALKSIPNKMLKPLEGKIGKKAALGFVKKVGAKLIPGIGTAMLLYSLTSIGVSMAQGKSLQSAVAEEFLGFDPWDDNSVPVDENGEPIKPDEKELEESRKKEEEKLQKEEEEKNKREEQERIQKEEEEKRKQEEKKKKETQKVKDPPSFLKQKEKPTPTLKPVVKPKVKEPAKETITEQIKTNESSTKNAGGGRYSDIINKEECAKYNIPTFEEEELVGLSDSQVTDLILATQYRLAKAQYLEKGIPLTDDPTLLNYSRKELAFTSRYPDVDIDKDPVALSIIQRSADFGGHILNYYPEAKKRYDQAIQEELTKKYSEQKPNVNEIGSNRALEDSTKPKPKQIEEPSVLTQQANKQKAPNVNVNVDNSPIVEGQKELTETTKALGVETNALLERMVAVNEKMLETFTNKKTPQQVSVSGGNKFNSNRTLNRK